MMLYEIFEEGLEIDLNSIKLVDIHHLPQWSIYDDQRQRITRPIIIKLENALLESEASSWDYVQKIKNNLKHIFSKFRQFRS